MQRIVILALDDVYDSSLALSVDTLEAANRLSGLSGGPRRFEPVVLSPGRKEITTRNGARHAVRSRLARGRAAALVVPGLGLATEAEIDRLLGSQDAQRVLRWLRRHGPSFPVVAASCSATFLLAESGLLDGEVATTTWWLAPVFRARYPEVDLDEHRMVTESGRYWCAGAALA